MQFSRFSLFSRVKLIFINLKKIQIQAISDAKKIVLVFVAIFFFNSRFEVVNNSITRQTQTFILHGTRIVRLKKILTRTSNSLELRKSNEMYDCTKCNSRLCANADFHSPPM